MGSHPKRSKGRFVYVPFNLMESEAWRSLPYSAHSLYMFVRTLYNGSNNGNLAITFRAVKKAGLFRSRDTFYKAREALWERGFIALVREGNWGSERECHLWALTTDEIDDNPKVGIRKSGRTDCWKHWVEGIPSPNFTEYRDLMMKKRAEDSRRARAHKS